MPENKSTLYVDYASAVSVYKTLKSKIKWNLKRENSCESVMSPVTMLYRRCKSFVRSKVYCHQKQQRRIICFQIQQPEQIRNCSTPLQKPKNFLFRNKITMTIFRIRVNKNHIHRVSNQFENSNLFLLWSCFCSINP